MKSNNTILSCYEDNLRQMFALRKQGSKSVDIIHRTLHPTKSSKFTQITLGCIELDEILNNTLAKPYTINLSENNLIVTDKTMQFIISEPNYVSIEIPNTSKIRGFFETAFNSLNSGENVCTHRNENGSTLQDKSNGIVQCDLCGNTFKLLDKEDIKEVEESADLLSNAIETLLSINQVTNQQAYMLRELQIDIENLPTVLKETLDQIDNF